MGALGPEFNVFDAAASGPAPPPLPVIPTIPGTQEPFSLLAATGGRYVQDSDALFFKWFDPTDGLVTVQVSARLLKSDGSVSLMVNAAQTDGSIFGGQVTWPLSEGFLLSICIVATNGSCLPGALYVSTGIMSNPGTAPVFEQVLAAGYLAPANDIVWPGGTIQRPGDGAGAALRIGPTGNNPSPLEIGNIPRGCKVLLHSCDVSIVTSAVVANRFAQLYINSGSVLATEKSWTGITPIPANSTVRATFAGSGEEISASGLLNIPMPASVELLSTWAVGINIINADVGDRVRSMAIDFELWAGYTSNP